MVDVSPLGPHSLRTDTITAMRRGWRGCCPRCGEAPLFYRFLKMQSVCPACNLALDPFRADDAPAYFTIFAVGHIVIPLVLVMERYFDEPPLWVHALIWLPFSVLLALWLLPRIKGAVIALQWSQSIHSSKPAPNSPRPVP
jgi:uncharacterized protein (DUF983 family)